MSKTDLITAELEAELTRYGCKIIRERNRKRRLEWVAVIDEEEITAGRSKDLVAQRALEHCRKVESVKYVQN